MLFNNYRRPEYLDIKYQNMRFLVSDEPNDQNLKKYIEHLTKLNVNVRVFQESSETNELGKTNNKLIDGTFENGQTSPEIREKLLYLLKEKYKQSPNTCISVHCVSGLERSSVMVVMALMELGMSYEEALELLRSKRTDNLSSNEKKFKSVMKKNRKMSNSFYSILKQKFFR